MVTGANGFIGQNLCVALSNLEHITLNRIDLETSLIDFESAAKQADFIVHLAGVNRPLDKQEFKQGNTIYTQTLIETLIKYKNHCPILFASSIQATLDNPYGISKKEAEDDLIQYSQEYNSKVIIYRFVNVFGKWCKPNYNSAVATFCFNIAHDLDIMIHDETSQVSLVYIDDVVKDIIKQINTTSSSPSVFAECPTFYTVTLRHIVNLLLSFKSSRQTLILPDLADDFTRKLYSTYLSYLPEDQFSYPLNTLGDERGTFSEIIKMPNYGQVSVNVTKPGIIKGEHYHHSKVEKFLVVSGEGIVRFRKIGSKQILEYPLSESRMEVLDIPPGYTHHIENTGDTNLVTIMWTNEIFDQKQPDTYKLEVKHEKT